jgi:poly(hydroxyalkanoate) depolymerase family esterase
MLKNPFLKKILAAGRLTRYAKLAETTATIQRALSAGALAGAHSRPAWPVAAGASGAEAPFVFDGLLREREPSRPAAEAASDVAPDLGVGGRFLESSFTGAAGTRAFKLFAPGGFAGETLSLVVMLHGCTQNPDDFAAGTRMNGLAQEDGFFVLYPAQAARSNAHKCWNWFSPADQRRGAGEPALLAGMVRHVLQTHPIDPDRVYVAGLSAGGAMAAILASEYPDLFGAAGVHSGLPAGAAHDVASAFSAMKSGPATPSPRSRSGAPVIVFHGDADATVAAANGDAVIAAALHDKGQVIAEAVDAPAAVGTRPVRRTVWRAAAAAPNAATLAEQWIVQGAPHAWSGGASAGSYTDPQGPDASREMLRFFRAHPRRRA